MKVLRIMNVATCSLLLTFLLLFTGFKMTLFSDSYLIQVATKSQYYQQLAKEVNISIQNVGLGSGVPSEVLQDLVSDTEIKESSDKYFHFIYGKDKSDVTSSAKAVANNAAAKINTYAESQGMEVVNQSENQFPATVENIFTKSIELPYMSSIGQRITSYQKYLTAGIVVVTILLLITGFLLLFPLRRYKHKQFRYLSYVLSSAGLLFVVFPAIALFSGVIERFAITTESLYLLFTAYITSVLQLFLVAGIVCLVLSISCGVASEKMRLSLIRYNKAKREQRN